MSTVELLAPAGNPEALDAALGEGADAIYLGARSFNARMRSNNFAFNQLEATVDVCHKQGKKVYVTVNTVFEQREADRMWQFLQYLERVGPDGIIVQDLGVVEMASKHFPRLNLHASTQMNVASAKGANLLSRRGFKRVVLARELSLDEIRAVRQATNLELEVFVHGALCVSESGLCLFSSYLGGKSANRGACAQACRRLYTTDAESGYFFSPDDFQLIDHVPDLMEAGVASFKIEGRMKSAEYVGQVVAAYRHMIDNWKLDRERALAKARSILQSDFARRKTTFFFAGKLDSEFIRPDQAGGTGISLGKVRDIRVLDEKRYALMESYDGLAEGDSLRFHRPDDSERFTAKVREVKSATNGMLVQVETDFRQGDIVYLVQTKSASRRYPQALPKSMDRYHQFPSHQDAPDPAMPKLSKADQRSLESNLPPGIYSLVGSVGDLHLLNAARPEKAMLLFTKANAQVMRAEEATLPFKRDNLVIWLDPWYPESDAEWLVPELEYWISRGQRLFVANNPAHLGLLRRKDAKGQDLVVIAGPYLYAFNRWAASFLFEEGASYVVPPLEISKQDFQKTSETSLGAAWMPIVFSYPALFHIRADLAANYDFKAFSDRDGTAYQLMKLGEGSVVTPMTPFSIVDRIPYLQKDGVQRFILDFSSIKLAKPLYKQVMRAALEGTVLPETDRFNWKEGFYQSESDK